MNRIIVAIDGPAGSGKSTVSRRVAERLGYTYLDTGALYRCTALHALRQGISLKDDVRLATVMPGLRIEFYKRPESTGVRLNGEDVSDAIRTPEVSMAASQVSAMASVRAGLLELQRALGREGGVVLEGRDIGTVVFPQAQLKIFLTASAEARAKRRHAELVQKGGKESLAEVLAATQQRDRQDAERTLAPLVQAPDAVPLDTTPLSIDEVVTTIADWALTRAAR